MLRGFYSPGAAVAAILLALVVLLATLQYRWLGQISAAERDRMTAALNAHAAQFAEDFDREMTRAYLLFQLDAPGPDQNVAARIAERYEQWQATARFPRIIGQVYVASAGPAGESLRRFVPGTGTLEAADWPDALNAVRIQIEQRSRPGIPLEGSRQLWVRSIAQPVWPLIPAIVVPMPIVLIGRLGVESAVPRPDLSYTIVMLDRGEISRSVLPALADQYFRAPGGAAQARTLHDSQRPGDSSVDYEVAVISTSADRLFQSPASFAPSLTAKVDAAADFFQVRAQDFAPLATEVRRFARISGSAAGSSEAQPHTFLHETITTTPSTAEWSIRPGAPMTVLVQGGNPALVNKMFAPLPSDRAAGVSAPLAAVPHWRVLVEHPAGSLEKAVDAERRRNLAISSGILTVLAVSIGLLIVSTRRAQRLARQQIEFVATVSHELRTPLAVIRSAADNLADGVVDDQARVRQYGELVRHEGVRLSDLVEQVLQLAGLQTGRRRFDLRPIAVGPLIAQAVADCRHAAPHPGVTIDVAIGDEVPPVIGDEAALRRVLHNLIGNAIKYGGDSKWVGVAASRAGNYVAVTVSDRGIGIAPSDHARVFDPFYRARDVIEGQIQGAGLGLSLVKRIVDAHGGRVSLESAPGQGSSFTLMLPTAIEPAAVLDGQRARAQQA
ncbi:MAG: sensor histidine kinase [Vicinamibacterales bacterium]